LVGLGHVILVLEGFSPNTGHPRRARHLTIPATLGNEYREDDEYGYKKPCVAQSPHRTRCASWSPNRGKSEHRFELLTVRRRMARAAHASGVRDLALAAQISPDTVARFERGEKLRQDTIRAIQRALEAAGCEFIIEDECGGTGMRLRKHVRIGG